MHACMNVIWYIFDLKFVCMYVCAHTSMGPKFVSFERDVLMFLVCLTYINVYVCICIHTCTYIYTCMYTSICIFINMRINRYIYMHTYVCLYRCVCVCVCVMVCKCESCIHNKHLIRDWDFWLSSRANTAKRHNTRYNTRYNKQTTYCNTPWGTAWDFLLSSQALPCFQTAARSIWKYTPVYHAIYTCIYIYIYFSHIHVYIFTFTYM